MIIPFEVKFLSLVCEITMLAVACGHLNRMGGHVRTCQDMSGLFSHMWIRWIFFGRKVGIEQPNIAAFFDVHWATGQLGLDS